jgi:YidC/Oxa1 family membrane protein insertase
MGMDRNTVIGFILIGILLIGMFYMNSRSRLAYEAEQKRLADSIAATQPKKDTLAARIDSLKVDSVKTVTQTGSFATSNTQEELVTVENNVMRVTFSSKGAQPRQVMLKQFKKADGTPVILQAGSFNRISYTVNTGTNLTAETADILFSNNGVKENPDKSKSIRFSATDSTGKLIAHEYTIRPDDYMIDVSIVLKGADRLVSNRKLNLLWQSEATQVEHNNEYELTQSHICYVKGGDYDFEYVGKGDEKSFSKSVDWISVKQQFFASTLIAKNKMQDASTKWSIPSDSNQHFLLRAVTTARLDVPGNDVTIPLQLYYGPSDYNILKKYHNQMENIVPYGSGIFAFVKYINRHFLLPVFDYLRQHIASMGIVILLLTLLIRLITSPILYKSYLSGAKMKVLKPEVDALKEKYKDDQQAFGMEQMKLWRSAGVNPLGGCLPALLQIPIFMSLYYFFQSNIDLRDKSFLWASDLSAYDVIARLPFKVPFYGDHVSLFTLTAVVTSLLISLYSMNNMQDNSNPLMKYMPYIFPVVLLGVFNNLPSALTWYYTVSNFITLVLQFVIQNYIIDHDKILAKMEENKKRPVKKSKMQERIEAMQETQKKMQELKNKGTKK